MIKMRGVHQRHAEDGDAYGYAGIKDLGHSEKNATS